MSRPTADTDTPNPSAISGSMPMTTNSVVPMPKAPMARASRARGTDGLQGTAARTRWGGLRRPAGASGEILSEGQGGVPGRHARDAAWVCSHGAGQGVSSTLTAPSFFSRKSA